MIYLDLQPEVEAQLTAEATPRSTALERYLQQIVASLCRIDRQHLLDQTPKADPRESIRLSLEELHRGEVRPAKESSTSSARSMPCLL